MKITAIIYSMNELKKVASAIDAAIIMDNKLGLVPGDVNMDEAIVFCNEANVEPIIGMNKMLHNSDLQTVRECYEKYRNSNVSFYITDLGAANLAIKAGLLSRVIYNPETMITNYLDLEMYKNMGFKSLGMSLEIPLADVKEAFNKTNASITLQVFGHHLMFYSKRSLLSLYGQKANISIDGNVRYLKEEKRSDLYPVIENQNGTLLYRPYQISLLKEINNISFLDYALFDPIYININKFTTVLEIYRNVINGSYGIATAQEKMNSLDLNISDGFTYNDSVYVKEEF